MKFILQIHCQGGRTFLTASITMSFVWHQSQGPVCSPFVIRTSATVTFSNPFCCAGGEVTHFKLETIFSIPAISLPCACYKIAALSISWHDRTALEIPCIIIPV